MDTANSITILIVDDTLTNLVVLGKTLEKVGYNVLKAESGPAGRKLAGEHKPDLILLDIMMPEEDGFETIQKLKANSVTNAIPVIFLTALDDMDSKIRGFELGAVDFIVKPFHPAEVRARVKLHIKLSIATNALIRSQSEKLKQVESAQQSLLVNPVDLPDAKFGRYYLALEEAGGDFYDVFKISEQTYGYFLGDISGHDIATSFVTAAIKALLKQNCMHIYEPCESMRMVNSVLLDVLPADKYLTATYLYLDRRDFSARIVCMGHPPIIYLPVTGDAEIIEGQGDLLGIFDEVIYNEVCIKVSPGDRFFLYSDGLIENETVWSANVENLRQRIAEMDRCDINDAPETLKNLMFSEVPEPDDDVVIVAVEV